MEFTLPVTGYSVVMFDYIPQRVFERFQEDVSRNIKIDMKYANVTIDSIAEELGADRALAIQNADEAERQLLMDEARREIVMKHAQAEIRLSDTHAAEREKIIGMVRTLSDGETELRPETTIPDLPRKDYIFLQGKIAEIESKDEEELKKGEGQSDASSTASPSTVRKTKGEQGS